MIFATMLARGRGFERTPPDEQRANARAAWRYGEWLRDEAEKCHALVVAARPQETLFERTLALFRAMNQTSATKRTARQGRVARGGTHQLTLHHVERGDGPRGSVCKTRAHSLLQSC